MLKMLIGYPLPCPNRDYFEIGNKQTSLINKKITGLQIAVDSCSNNSEKVLRSKLIIDIGILIYSAFSLHCSKVPNIKI